MTAFVARKTVGAWRVQNVRRCRCHFPPRILIRFEKRSGQLLNSIHLAELPNLVDIDLGVLLELRLAQVHSHELPSVVPTTLTAILSVGLSGSVNVNVAESESQSHRA